MLLDTKNLQEHDKIKFSISEKKPNFLIVIMAGFQAGHYFPYFPYFLITALIFLILALKS